MHARKRIGLLRICGFLICDGLKVSKCVALIHDGLPLRFSTSRVCDLPWNLKCPLYRGRICIREMMINLIKKVLCRLSCGGDRKSGGASRIALTPRSWAPDTRRSRLLKLPRRGIRRSGVWGDIVETGTRGEAVESAD